jgi:hypothetical protein
MPVVMVNSVWRAMSLPWSQVTPPFITGYQILVTKRVFSLATASAAISSGDLQHTLQQQRHTGLTGAVTPYLGNHAGGRQHLATATRCTFQECLHHAIASVVTEQGTSVENQRHAAPSAPITTRDVRRACATSRSTSAASNSPISLVSASSAAHSRRCRTRAAAASASQVDTLTPRSAASARTITASSGSKEMDSFSVLTTTMLPAHYHGNKRALGIGISRLGSCSVMHWRTEVQLGADLPQQPDSDFCGLAERGMGWLVDEPGAGPSWILTR